jgi:hypothetical protein
MREEIFDVKREKIIQKCQTEINQEEKYITELIKDIENISDFRETDDYKTYGLIPGQQIYYNKAFNLPVPWATHHAIYLYDGLVIEGSAGPKICKKIPRNKWWALKDQIIGLETLEHFLDVAKKRKSAIYTVYTLQDTDKKTIIDRLKRAREVLGVWDYDLLTNNCEGVANYISYGTKKSHQTRLLLIWVMVLIILILAIIYLKNGKYK